MSTLPLVSMEAGAITARTVAVFLVASWPRRVLLGSLLMIPVLVGALGGFRDAPPEVRDVPPGSPVDLQVLTVTPTAFFVSDETQRWNLEYAEADGWVGVVVTVENTWDRWVSLDFSGPGSDAVTPVLADGVLAGDTRSTPQVVVRLEDATMTYALPGVPTEVVMLWPVTDMGALEDELAITMTEQEWVYAPLSGEERWLSDDDQVWTTTLPRIELPDDLYEPPEDL